MNILELSNKDDNQGPKMPTSVADWLLLGSR